MIQRQIKRLVKNAALIILGNPEVLKRRVKAISAANALTILNLHRVNENDGSSYRPMAPRLFEDLLAFLTKHFELVTFSDLHEASSSGRPKLILSFDDGYKDFIDVTAPILDKYRIRVNHNVIPECIESGLPPFNVLAQDFIGKAPDNLLKELTIPGFSIRELAGNRVVMGIRVSAFLKNRSMDEQRELANSIAPQFSRFDGFKPTPMMSRTEIQQLATVHEFGAHSYSHASMSFETDEYFRKDLENCRQYFTDKLKVPTNIYAFPNGSCRSGQIELARFLGYRHVLLVGDSFSRLGNAVHPRFGIDAETRPEALYRALGGLRNPRATVQAAL